MRNKNGGIRSGRTIAGKLERPISDSERARARKRARGLKALRVVLVLVASVILVGVIIGGVIRLMEAVGREAVGNGDGEGKGYELTATVVDEAGVGVTESTKRFLANLEEDLGELGYRVARAVLPVGKMRQVNIYLEGREGYIKVRTDRGTGVQAEDADRMLRHLDGKNYEYIDVRVERKGYYK